MIDGIEYVKNKKYLVATISELSDDLKDVIRERFAAICHGEQNTLTERGIYTYPQTVKEFLKRIESKGKRIQTGMLGELIIHVLTGIVYPGYKTIVPYFNLEDRNIKKGFDSVIYSLSMGVWVYEVKSSKEPKLRGSADTKIKQLIKTAHEDLGGKLQQQDEVSRLWGTAMSGFRVACGHLDEKAVLETIILDHQDEALVDGSGPECHNVILSSVLISDKDELDIDSASITEKYAEYEDTYNELMIFAVHKSILIDLIDFFRQEVADEDS